MKKLVKYGFITATIILVYFSIKWYRYYHYYKENPMFFFGVYVIDENKNPISDASLEIKNYMPDGSSQDFYSKTDEEGTCEIGYTSPSKLLTVKITKEGYEDYNDQFVPISTKVKVYQLKKNKVSISNNNIDFSTLNTKINISDIEFEGYSKGTFRYIAKYDEKNKNIVKLYEKYGYKVTTAIAFVDKNNVKYHFPVSEKFKDTCFDCKAIFYGKVYSDKQLGKFIIIEKMKKLN